MGKHDENVSYIAQKIDKEEKKDRIERFVFKPKSFKMD
jgi:hypothetical protein